MAEQMSRHDTYIFYHKKNSYASNLFSQYLHIQIHLYNVVRVCNGPSLCSPILLWSKFVMIRVCYGPRCHGIENINASVQQGLEFLSIKTKKQSK
jgi:hypothetical protein